MYKRVHSELVKEIYFHQNEKVGAFKLQEL
jgi:hypothetical protein